MVFSDPMFIFLFMPVFLILYYVISANFLNAYILVGSLLFRPAYRVTFQQSSKDLPYWALLGYVLALAKGAA